MRPFKLHDIIRSRCISVSSGCIARECIYACVDAFIFLFVLTACLKDFRCLLDYISRDLFQFDQQRKHTRRSDHSAVFGCFCTQENIMCKCSCNVNEQKHGEIEPKMSRNNV